jgi:hypothetical protein
MPVSESARVGPDIIVRLIATLGSSDGRGYRMGRDDASALDTSQYKSIMICMIFGS